MFLVLGPGETKAEFTGKKNRWQTFRRPDWKEKCGKQRCGDTYDAVCGEDRPVASCLTDLDSSGKNKQKRGAVSKKMLNLVLELTTLSETKYYINYSIMISNFDPQNEAALACFSDISRRDIKILKHTKPQAPTLLQARFSHGFSHVFSHFSPWIFLGFPMFTTFFHGFPIFPMVFPWFFPTLHGSICSQARRCPSRTAEFTEGVAHMAIADREVATWEWPEIGTSRDGNDISYGSHDLMGFFMGLIGNHFCRI